MSAKQIIPGSLGLLILLAAFCCLALAAPAEEDDPSKEEMKLPEPSFKPGAAVGVQVQLVAPKGWELNHLLPIALSFDKEYLKDAPFTVTQENWQFTIKDYQDSFNALIPIKISPKIGDGVFEVPLHLDCSICNKAAGACTFASEDFSFSLHVVSSSDKGSKDQAQAKGVISLVQQIQVPE